MPSSPRQARLIAAIAAIAVGVAVWAHGGASLAQTRRFDIPAQPLDEALTVFATSSGLQLLYDSSLAAGRTSGKVSGTLEPRQALETLLAGTGLNARFTAAGAVVIYAASSTNTVALRPITAVAAPVIGGDVDPAARRYAEDVQRRVVAALQADTALSDRDYVIAVRLWIGETGQPGRIDVLSGTGDAERDAGFVAFVSDLRFEQPPSHLPQPMRVEFRVRRVR